MFSPHLNLNLAAAELHPTAALDLHNLPIRKLFHWLPDGSLQLRIDWSSIEKFLGCNRSAEYSLVHSRTARKSSPLVFGAAMHAALEIWYKNQPVEDSARGELLGLCKTAIDLSFAEDSAYLRPDDYRTSDYCYESFIKYIAHYRNEIILPVVHNSQKLVEFSFSMPIGQVEIDPTIFHNYGYGTLTDDEEKERDALRCGAVSEHLPCSLEWTGIIDMVADLSGETWLMDHKTTSILSGDFFDGFEIAMQPVGYVAAAKSALPDLDIKGFMVNVLACRKPTKTGVGFEPLRRFYRYEQWHFDEWKQDALALIEEFLSNLHSSFFPRKTQWCIGKYGKCPYFETCSLQPELRKSYLDSDAYVSNTWKPVQ